MKTHTNQQFNIPSPTRLGIGFEEVDFFLISYVLYRDTYMMGQINVEFFCITKSPMATYKMEASLDMSRRDTVDPV